MMRRMKFASAGLRRFYERKDTRRLNPDHIERIRKILASLDLASSPKEMDFPSYRLHSLKGAYRGFWSVRVSKNWRIVFRFVKKEAVDVDLLDYHN